MLFRSVSGPVPLDAPGSVKLIKVKTAEEMKKEIMREALSCSVVVMAAAVADFTPRKVSGEKIKKEGKKSLTLELSPTVDILKELVKQKIPEQIIVGFAAETEDLKGQARAKIKEKQVDLLIANDVSREDSGFDSDFNRAVILYRDGREVELDLMSKMDLAVFIWEAIVELSQRRL